MQRRVFFLTRLKPGKDPDEYERFLREYDYPQSKKLLPIVEYKATRIEGRALSEGDVPCQYIEVIDVSDLDAYRAAIASPTPEVQELFDRVMEWLDSYTDLVGPVVE